MAPLAKTGAISPEANLWAAAFIGFLFGFVLQRSGFTDSRKIARAFYFRDVDVPVVMWSAIVTGALGLWGLALLGVLDVSLMYFLPTFLAPMVVGGLIFGVGMVVGGYCPGTGAAAAATGKLDAMVFILGFFAGTLSFGDAFPLWEDFYASDYRGVWRLDQLLGIQLGQAVLLVTLVAVAGIWVLRRVQRLLWPRETRILCREDRMLGVSAVVLAALLAGFPTSAFIPEPPPAYYLVPKARAPGVQP
jgi:uncharacterized membrane protein YedE/YeeE